MGGVEWSGRLVIIGVWSRLLMYVLYARRVDGEKVKGTVVGNVGNVGKGTHYLCRQEERKRGSIVACLDVVVRQWCSFGLR
ncbi:uncharacterized protein J3D65DRAFT_619181 [Phyllosticta citribraziliensis]|uniref:Uncharacterized protein n=1 Tax=Phyllosticta citribraziliensis TaxID=989973 RepID=A0ABR1LY81_9PEZI